MRRLLPALLLVSLAGCTDPVLWMLDRPTPATLELPDEYAETSFSTLLAQPGHFLDQGVEVVCRYHAPTEIFIPAYTDFADVSHRNFSVWVEGSPLWTPAGWAADIPCFYVSRKDADLISRLNALKPLDRIEVRALVACVFGGRPFLRVDRIRRLGGPELTLEHLGHIHAATEACAAGRWEGGVGLSRTALDEELPEGAEPLLHRTLGRCLLESGSYSEALEELECSEGQDPDILVWKGRACLGLSRPAPAAGFFEAALSRAQLPGTHLLLAEARRMQGDAQKALASAARASTLAPGDKGVLLATAGLQDVEGRLDLAVESTEAALKLDPNQGKVWASLGRLQFRRGDLKAAHEAFQQAMLHATDSEPLDADELYLDARALLALGRPDEARSQLESALAKPGPWGGQADAQGALGDLALARGDWPSALACFRTADALSPWDPAFLGGLGTALLHQGDPEGARKALESARSRHPGTKGSKAAKSSMATLEENLARACAALGDLSSARKAIRRACEVEESAPRRCLEGQIARASGDAQEAEPALARASTLAPADAGLLLARADLLLTLERRSEALQLLDQVEQLTPSNPFLPCLRAEALLADGKEIPRALILAETAFASDPDQPGIQAVYGWALLASDRPSEAILVLKQAAQSRPDAARRLAEAQAKAGVEPAK